MGDTPAGKDPMAAPSAPAMAASDPDMFAPLTCDENQVLRDHLGSGWTKQHVVYPALSEPWKETSAVLDDLTTAWWTRWQTGQEPEGGQ